MKKILVIVADYPNNDDGVTLMYVHTRNRYYVQHDIDVTVLNFKTKENYVIDGISVITLQSYKQYKGIYDSLILHAPNLRNHYLFLRRYGHYFQHFIFFFHGHEVLEINKCYPKPYDYVKKQNILKRVGRNLYDKVKCMVWHYYFPKISNQADFIFVSDWLYQRFERFVKLRKEDLSGNVYIINNSVGSIFEDKTYLYGGDKKYDFITIRNCMDDSKYCIDLVVQLARKYTGYKFLIIGRGNYFNVYDIPFNVTWIDGFLNHEQIRTYLDQSKCGLLLTRQDTQGVMACELLAYGIPLITSNIAVCQEIFKNENNVKLIDNHVDHIDLETVFNELVSGYRFTKTDTYSYNNTVKKEENLILK